MSHIVVTGANGFVGRALCRLLVARGHTVTGLVRHAGGCVTGVSEWLHSGKDFSGLDNAWPDALQADAIVHLAARVHVMRDESADPDMAFRAANVDGTLRVAEAAVRHGVPRFVFVSSIKAVAETDEGIPLTEDVPVRPQDAYGRSKLEAEQALLELHGRCGLEVTRVRPPLVYGPGVRANFLALMNAVSRGIPLPLGSITARRSIVYVENLADALLQCAVQASAANSCFHVADDDLSVACLVDSLGRHMHRPAKLISVPASVLRLAGVLTGRSAQVERLTGSLRLDTFHIRTALGWTPPYSTEEGLAATAGWYLSTH